MCKLQSATSNPCPLAISVSITERCASCNQVSIKTWVVPSGFNHRKVCKLQFTISRVPNKNKIEFQSPKGVQAAIINDISIHKGVQAAMSRDKSKTVTPLRFNHRKVRKLQPFCKFAFKNINSFNHRKVRKLQLNETLIKYMKKKRFNHRKVRKLQQQN